MKTTTRKAIKAEVPRDKPEQIALALRIAGPLRERIAAVAAALSDEAQTTTLSDVARRCLIAHLPNLEKELGLTTSEASRRPAKPQSRKSDTEQ